MDKKNKLRQAFYHFFFTCSDELTQNVQDVDATLTLRFINATETFGYIEWPEAVAHVTSKVKFTCASSKLQMLNFEVQEALRTLTSFVTHPTEEVAIFFDLKLSFESSNESIKKAQIYYGESDTKMGSMLFLSMDVPNTYVYKNTEAHPKRKNYLQILSENLNLLIQSIQQSIVDIQFRMTSMQKSRMRGANNQPFKDNSFISQQKIRIAELEDRFKSIQADITLNTVTKERLLADIFLQYRQAISQSITQADHIYDDNSVLRKEYQALLLVYVELTQETQLIVNEYSIFENDSDRIPQFAVKRSAEPIVEQEQILLHINVFTSNTSKFENEKISRHKDLITDTKYLIKKAVVAELRMANSMIRIKPILNALPAVVELDIGMSRFSDSFGHFATWLIPKVTQSRPITYSDPLIWIINNPTIISHTLLFDSIALHIISVICESSSSDSYKFNLPRNYISTPYTGVTIPSFPDINQEDFASHLAKCHLIALSHMPLVSERNGSIVSLNLSVYAANQQHYENGMHAIIPIFWKPTEDKNFEQYAIMKLSQLRKKAAFAISSIQVFGIVLIGFVLATVATIIAYNTYSKSIKLSVSTPKRSSLKYQEIQNSSPESVLTHMSPRPLLKQRAVN